MKTRPHINVLQRISVPFKAGRLRQIFTPRSSGTGENAEPDVALSPQAAQRILISLMLPSMLMPLASSMSRVALPIIRDDFQIPADMTAWVATVFTLPFMILMPLYGRLSDGLGKRRLILAGIIIFSIGTAITLAAADLTWLMVGRAVQGIGVAGMMPLGMALISAIFSKEERGKALGTWSSVGPVLAFVGPLLAGFLIERWGWRSAFAPPLVVGLVAFVIVAKFVPAGLSQIKPNFLRTFDWTGVILLSTGLTSLLFYLSSRPITGVAPLQDWRLLATTLLFMGGFVYWETQRKSPFVALGIFKDKIFSLGSVCASLRMFGMGGVGFLIPLYLVDVHEFSAAYLGGMLMITPGLMTFTVRLGGQAADRWGSRWPVMIGFAVQVLVAIIFSQLSETAPIWVIIAVLAFNGLGVGTMLAALHRVVMGNIPESEMGSTAGVYSMIRFAGMVIGTALAGVMLENYLSQSLPAVEAYQAVFFFFAGLGLIGLISGFFLREQSR